MFAEQLLQSACAELSKRTPCEKEERKSKVVTFSMAMIGWVPE